MDVLHGLGLTALSNRDNLYEGTNSPSTSSSIYATSPSTPNRLPPGVGILLDPNTLYEAPAGLFSTEIGNEFTVVVSLSSRQANNAFLLSVKDGQDRVRFGIQLLPHRVVVYTADQASVYFTYDWQDGHQHSFAVGVHNRSVSFHAKCGAVYQWEQTLGRAQPLGSHRGLFTLGRMNSKAAPFQGRVCQLDIYPSAQAAAHYCNYLRKQCRLADTFRSSPSPADLDLEANDSPSEPLVESSFPEAGAHYADPTPTSAQTASLQPLSLIRYHTQYSTLGPTVQPHLGEQTNPHPGGFLVHTSTTPLHHETLISFATTNMLEGSDLKHRTTTFAPASMPVQGTRWPQRNLDHFDNNTEGDSSPRRPHSATLFSNTSTSNVVQIPRPRLTNENLEVQHKANRTTLYRHNQLDISEEHGLDASYVNVDAEGYDYGYEEQDYFYDYEGFLGPKGDPGSEVGAFMNENLSYEQKQLSVGQVCAAPCMMKHNKAIALQCNGMIQIHGYMML